MIKGLKKWSLEVARGDTAAKLRAIRLCRKGEITDQLSPEDAFDIEIRFRCY